MKFIDIKKKDGRVNISVKETYELSVIVENMIQRDLYYDGSQIYNFT